MRISQRQVVIGMYGVLTIGAVFYALLFTVTNQMAGLSAALIGLVIYGSLLVFYWRGWEPARYLGLLILTLLVGIVMPEPFVTGYAPALLTLIPVVALLLGNVAWVVASSVLVILILLIRAGGQGIYTDPTALITFAMIVGGVILSRLVTETAQRHAEEQAARAEQALTRSEAQAADLSVKAAELAAQNDEQRRLLDLVATLETPAVALAEGVLLAPVVGHLDSRRAGILTDKLLQEVSATRARLVVLDIAGVPAVDTAVSQALLRAIQAVRLLGCEVTITGISATIATTMTHLGVNLGGVRTARTPQEALEQALIMDRRSGQPNGVRKN